MRFRRMDFLDLRVGMEARRLRLLRVVVDRMGARREGVRLDRGGRIMRMGVRRGVRLLGLGCLRRLPAFRGV